MTKIILDAEFFSITDALVANAMRILRKNEGFAQREIERIVRKKVRKNILGSAKTISAIKVLNFIEKKRLKWLENEKEIIVGDLRLQFHKSPIHSDTNEQYTAEIRTQPTSKTTYEWRFLKSKGTMTTYTLVEVYASTVSAKKHIVFDASAHEFLNQEKNLHLKIDPQMVVNESAAFFKLFKNHVLEKDAVLEKAILEDKHLKAANMLLEKDGGLFGYKTIKLSLEIENRSSLS